MPKATTSEEGRKARHRAERDQHLTDAEGAFDRAANVIADGKREIARSRGLLDKAADSDKPGKGKANAENSN